MANNASVFNGVTGNPQKRTLVEPAEMSALCHVWTYMDPARLQQADWIRCNRHNC